jgi:hypothetical protein
MGKTIRNIRHHQRRMKPQSKKVLSPEEQERKARRRRAIALITIAVLAAIPFSLGKYFEFNSPGPFDSGAYVYSAAHILQGAKIGVDEKPSAQLGTLLVNLLGVRLFGFSDTGPKIIQTIMQAAALIVMFIVMTRLFGSMLPAAVGVIIASSYLSAPAIAKFGNVKEQYMIACMVMGVSCFVLYQLGGRWWLAVLAGGFLSWAPLFKPTGVSAAGAIGLFVILQPILKNRTWKQTGFDILLLFAGVVIAIAPLYIWILAWNVQIGVPYSFLWRELGKMLPRAATEPQAKPASDYVSESRKLVPFSQQWPIVLRYYGVLILPIALAVGAIIARVIRMIWQHTSVKKASVKSYDRFVLLFAIWWLLDMAFIWISPRSYEQYYLPLNASAAMLGGFLIAIYSDKIKDAVSKTKWVVVGTIGVLLMITLSQNIFFGLGKSPHSGIIYTNAVTGKPERQRGYLQKWAEISYRRKENKKGAWEIVGEYIRAHSQPSDKIYVWGWFPGIYVQAQRFSSASKAFSMPRPAPQVLARIVENLLAEFKQQMPKFIVDSRKRHIPTDRPPYELWPIVPQGFIGMEKTQFLPPNKNTIETFDKAWSAMLRERFDEDEALRYEALRPFRDFVMKNYKIVRMFGQHVLFELKSPPALTFDKP